MASKKYNESHREINKIKQRTWRANNRERHRAYTRKYNFAHSEQRKENYRRISGSVIWRYNHLKSYAKSRNRACSVSFKEYEILVSNSCHYCDGDLPKRGHGLDRINSKLDYVLSNVRPCCTTCNRSKGNLTDSEFKEWLFKISKWAKI